MRKFIIGTDWWTDCDDAVAMRLAARAHKAGDIEIIGIGINACMEYSAASLDGFLQLEGAGDIPIGIDLAGDDFGGNPPYQKRLSASAKRLMKNEDAEDAVRLYRRLLARSGGGVEIAEIGFLQVVSALLESGADDISEKTGIELVRENVTKFWVMAGKWDVENGIENNFARNARAIEAAHIFCEKCPVPVTFLGWEVSFDVITGSKLSRDDHLGMVLLDHGSENGRMSWDPMLMLMALDGDEEKAGYDVVLGTATVDDVTGANNFASAENGSHAYVIKKMPNDYYRDRIDGLIG